MLLALGVFFVAYLAIASEKFPRHWIALAGGAMLVVFGILSPSEAFHYVNWETLGLLFGMFVLVSILTEAGFFKWLAMQAVRRVNYHPSYLFIALILLAGVLAMFMDSITVMLFLAALSLQLCILLKLDPIPLIIAEVCAANTGGAATLVGDPPNVILGTSLGFNFADFASNTGPISLMLVIGLLAMFYFINRQSLKNAHAALNPEVIAEIEALHRDPLHARLSKIGLIGFGAAVTLLVTHHWLAELTPINLNAAEAALIPALLAFAFLPQIDKGTVSHKLLREDSENLLFFLGLFVLIGGLEKVHVFEAMANFIAATEGPSNNGVVMALHWGPGLLSGVVDNVPLALAMSYVVRDLSQHPAMPAMALMVWSLALGLDVGGNMTPIGASANVVAYAYLERHHGPVGWKRWVLIAVPPTLLAMAFASAMLMLKGHFGWY